MSAPQPPARSMLFVPGNSGPRLDGAAGRGADTLVLDLEDAVPASQKVAAREAVVEFIGRHRSHEPLVVRVNAPGTPWFDDDVRALRTARLETAMLPKASSENLAGIGSDGLSFIALIETAQGLEDAYAVARDPRVARLMLGSADLAADVGFELTRSESELQYARSRVAYASAAAGLPGPVDVVYLDVHDPDGLASSARRAHALGCTGKACIHPAQLATVNDVFTPTADEIRAAQRLVSEFEKATTAGEGALLVDGRLVDLPVVERARRTLALAPERLT